MALAQQPELLLLDEPTTYLDIAHQLDLLELVVELNTKKEMTIVMVLHDLNQASQYSDFIFVMDKGQIVARGTPQQVLNNEILESVFQVRAKVEFDADSLKPQFHQFTRIKKEEV